MIIKKILFLVVFVGVALQLPCEVSLREQFKADGYVEICDETQGTFDSLYVYFDELVEFFKTNPVWAQKLYAAKERFIRSKDRSYYGTDFFGFYDESESRGQIAFYYSTHFHEFIYSQYRELKEIPEVRRFFEACLEIQRPYGYLFQETAKELGIEGIFLENDDPPILFKVIKYLPSYTAVRPHYDGSAFSLFLDSTDNSSLLLSSYKSSFTVSDFAIPIRRCPENSIILIPGVLLRDCSINPTPHIVLQSGKTRYAAIAFAMRPNQIFQKNEFTPLPSFTH